MIREDIKNKLLRWSEPYDEVKCDYFDESTNCLFVDAWKRNDVEEEGETVAVVFPNGKVFYADGVEMNSVLLKIAVSTAKSRMKVLRDYKEFEKKNGVAPTYAHVNWYWKDNDEMPFKHVIKIEPDTDNAENNPEDDEIAFYVPNIYALMQLISPTYDIISEENCGEDFYITGVEMFSTTLH